MKIRYEISYKKIIPVKYLIPRKLLSEYRIFIAQKIIKKKTGRPRIIDDKLIAGIYYLLKTGCQWEALPLCFGSSKTVYHRFKELIALDAFRIIWKRALNKYEDCNMLFLRDQIIDSNHRKSPLGGEKTGKSPVDRRKLGTKIALCVDGNGIPIASAICGGNTYDTNLIEPIIEDLKLQIPQPINSYMHYDKGFLSKKNKLILISHNFIPIFPEKKYKNKPLKNDNEKDKKRWVVERTFSWISRFRRLFTRYERRAKHYSALLQFAFQVIILNKI
jgi:putative transposase